MFITIDNMPIDAIARLTCPIISMPKERTVKLMTTIAIADSEKWPISLVITLCKYTVLIMLSWFNIVIRSVARLQRAI